ncbi:MAG: protein arginine kinase [Eubacteriales bacterium]
MMWDNENKDKDIVVSSRIRLARNIKNLPFPLFLSDDSAEKIVHMVDDVVLESTDLSPFTKIELKQLTSNEKRMLVEKHLTSPELGNHAYSTVFIRNDEKVSIMINEEDHIRIQCILEGFQLENAYAIANKVDDLLEAKISYCFDEKYGYLTSCPTNLGTGMRASVMLHLPSLTLSNQMNSFVQTLARFGITIRGIYGEGTEALGDLYQISNQTTLGVNEQGIITNIHDVSKEIIKRERDLRYEILNNNRIYLEDKIYRAFGILSHARSINLEESMKLLSLVRLGSDLNLVGNDIKIINNLIETIQPGILSDIYQNELRNKDIDRIRAEHIRKCFNQ